MTDQAAPHGHRCRRDRRHRGASADYGEFLAIQEDLHLRIMDIVAANGTGFAFPSQTTYLATDSGVDPTRQSAAEAQVRRWRAEGRMPFRSSRRLTLPPYTVTALTAAAHDDAERPARLRRRERGRPGP